jgi:formiminotetrahydrofolate cyclodeaminase
LVLCGLLQIGTFWRGGIVSDKLTQRPVTEFLDALASSAPAPGGGSVAALSGALGAALLSMVCNLTLGKKRYAAVQDDIAALVERSEELRQRLTGLLEADVAVYTGVSTAYKMPRKSPEEKAARSAAIQEALKAAAQVPMQVAEACVEVLGLCTQAAELGNVNAVSDAGVAALMAEAGLRSAALNVIINVNSIKDQTFSGRLQSQLDTLLEGRSELKDQVYDLVVEKL